MSHFKSTNRKQHTAWLARWAGIPVSPLKSEFIYFNRLNWQRANRLNPLLEIPHHWIIIQIIRYQTSDFIQPGQIVIGQ